MYTSFCDNLVLCGYYTLATKFIKIKRSAMPSRNMARRFFGFGVYDHDLDEYSLIAPLIGQLGKNYTNGYNKLITGDELIGLAFLSVRTAQYIVGAGKFVYIECENIKVLIEFYRSHGFWQFGSRKIEKDESGLKGTIMIQMIKFFDGCEYAPVQQL